MLTRCQNSDLTHLPPITGVHFIDNPACSLVACVMLFWNKHQVMTDIGVTRLSGYGGIGYLVGCLLLLPRSPLRASISQSGTVGHTKKSAGGTTLHRKPLQCTFYFGGLRYTVRILPAHALLLVLWPVHTHLR